MLDFPALCKDHRIPCVEGSGHHHAHSGWIQTNCPFCTDGTYGNHLGFNLSRGNFNCWRCGSHKVWATIKQLLHLKSNGEVSKIIDKYQLTKRGRTTRKLVTRKRTIALPLGCGPLSKAHRMYLKKRRFDPKALETEWGLLGTRHLSKEWNWRIVAPICSEIGDTLAYVGRAIEEEVKPKYRMSNNEDILVDPRQMLYGLDKVEGDAVLIVEGPADVWRMGPGAVATLGIDWKEEQAVILSKFKRRFVMYDPEPLAQKQAMKLAKRLSLFAGDTEVVEGVSSDPGELHQDEADEIMVELGLRST